MDIESLVGIFRVFYICKLFFKNVNELYNLFFEDWL